MPEDDIYGSKEKYERFLKNLESITKLQGPNHKYYCKNRANLKYFNVMDKLFNSRDTSYIRRIRLSRTFLISILFQN